MGAIKSDMTGGTLTLRLDRPPVNALDVATLDELSDRLDAASAEDVQAVVLTGSGPVFSAGADLYRVLDGGGDYVNT